MNKKPDFGNDLANLNDNVTAAVDDVLQVLQQKRTASRPDIAPREAVTPREQPDSATVVAPSESAKQTPSSPRRQRFASRSRLVPEVDHDEPLENVTTRLRQKTNERLTEAALRQRLKKETPASRQDIIEAALTDWFRKHGYSRSQGEDSTNS